MFNSNSNKLGGEIYLNGDYFEGNFVVWSKKGRGVYYWKGGDFYEGEYLFDKLIG